MATDTAARNTLRALLYKAERLLGMKSINEIIRVYSDQLTNFAYEAMNGTMSMVDLSRAMRALIRDLGDDAYIEGMREGGIKDPEEVLDKEDEDVIKNWMASQVEHVKDFAAAAVTVKDSENPNSAWADILARIDYWVRSLESLGQLGYASAKENEMCTWQYGDTEHCDTCKGLNGKRRRLKWFTSNGYLPRQPGSETLDCKGYNCQCRGVNDDGERIL